MNEVAGTFLAVVAFAGCAISLAAFSIRYSSKCFDKIRCKCNLK